MIVKKVSPQTKTVPILTNQSSPNRQNIDTVSLPCRNNDTDFSPKRKYNDNKITPILAKNSVKNGLKMGYNSAKKREFQPYGALGNDWSFATPKSKTMKKWALLRISKEYTAWRRFDTNGNIYAKGQNLKESSMKEGSWRRPQVCSCMTVQPHTKIKDIEFWKKNGSGDIILRGLHLCGSVWTCPICSKRITAFRAREITQAGEAHKAQGGELLLFTYTFPHYFGDSLNKNLDRFRAAHRKFRSGKAWAIWKEKYSWIGAIRGLEVTHTNNGWHPHFHELHFIKNISDEEINKIKYDLLLRWQKFLRHEGLIPHDEKYFHRAFDARRSTKVDYIAKFCAPSYGLELAGSPNKKSKKGLAPFQILQSILNSGINKKKYYIALWRDYTEAFFNKRMLVWSRGLKERFHIEEIEDNAIMEYKPENAVFEGSIKRENYFALLKKGNFDEFLAFLERHTFIETFNKYFLNSS